jgi:UDP-2,3-diacylglucosamine pyrophosphatase LpxH
VARTAIILSDTHLGTERADPDGLRTFLTSLGPRASRLRLILNRDIVDLWRATDEEAARASSGVFAALGDLMDDGAVVDWVIGNHDHHLLRSLDGEGSPVLGSLPRGVRFHHPHRRLVQRGRVFLITHGDIYDFLYLPLEQSGPLSWALDPTDVYDFYDWVYTLDKDLVSAFDRLGTRGLLLAWLAERWREVWTALSGATPTAPSPAWDTSVQAATATQMTRTFSLDPVEVVRTAARLDLDEVWARTAIALAWKGIRYVTPHPRRATRRRFRGYHEVVTGHFHDPRQGCGPGWAVADAGSWWDGPGNGGTYIEIADGISELRRWPDEQAHYQSANVTE